MNKYSETTKKRYRIFGLNVLSDFVLEELSPVEGEAVIQIIRGKITGEINDCTKRNIYFQSSNCEFLFNVKNVGRILISNGQRIIIDPVKNSDISILKRYLYGTAFEILFLQRGILALHGSAVVIDGKCIIITGASGAGKSTLAFALRQLGYRFISDDVVFLFFSTDGTIWAYPNFPVHKLFKDSLDAVGQEMYKNSQLYSKNEHKYFVSAHTCYQEDPVPLCALWELKADNCNEVSINQLHGMEKLSVILNQTYCNDILYLFNSETNFRRLALLAESTYVYRMMRPQSKFTIDDQVKLILAKSKENSEIIKCY